MSDETKKCPYCGEEILAIAVKCKHCGEFVDKSAILRNNIASANVNEKWKKRFEMVEKVTVDGQWWKYKPEYIKMSIGEKLKATSELYTSDIGSTISAVILGAFYYLFKGMWLKFVVYSAACIGLALGTAGLGTVSFWVLFVIFAPYDYYRLKVLGKQW